MDENKRYRSRVDDIVVRRVVVGVGHSLSSGLKDGQGWQAWEEREERGGGER